MRRPLPCQPPPRVEDKRVKRSRAAKIFGVAPAFLAVAAIAASLVGCIEQTIDMRARSSVTPPEPSCPDGQRQNPASGVCEPCVLMQPLAEDVCPCAFHGIALDFPYCAGEGAAYECLPCTGGIARCRTFNAALGTTSSCALLAACCAQLESSPGAVPCCALGAQLNCIETNNLGQYAVSCVAETCCTPACQSEVEYCCRDCGCVCARAVPPN